MEVADRKDKERARGAHEQVRLLRREIEAQKARNEWSKLERCHRGATPRGTLSSCTVDCLPVAADRGRHELDLGGTTGEIGWRISARRARGRCRLRRDPQLARGSAESRDLPPGPSHWGCQVPSQALPEAFAQLKDEILELQRRRAVKRRDGSMGGATVADGW
eukprot:Skav204063  [mRNA]  locus=scaffold3:449905:452528:- [translate_table: standard]